MSRAAATSPTAEQSAWNGLVGDGLLRDGARPQGPGRGRPRPVGPVDAAPAASPTRSGSPTSSSSGSTVARTSAYAARRCWPTLLPASVGYPRTIAYGGELGADWLIAERRPGEMLSVCWPDMTEFEREQRRPPARRHAARPAPGAVPDATAARRRHPAAARPDADPGVRARCSPRSTSSSGTRPPTGVSTDVIADVRHLVLAATAALEPYSTATLIHGDLHFQNVLWDGFSVTGLLDLEWARGAPPDLDLDVFLRFCAHPHWFVAPEYSDRVTGRGLRVRAVLVGRRTTPSCSRTSTRSSAPRCSRSPTTCATSATK